MTKVVDLRTRPGYQPDCAAIARRRLATARRVLDLSAAEFAAMLTPLVGYPVTGETVEAWETDSVPPADVLVAADTATPEGDTGEQMIGGVLSKIPQSFSPEALCGAWVTCFRFGPGSARKAHVDIAQISTGSDRLLTITNHPPAPRSEGRASPFRNELEAQMANRHLVGHWKNSNDTRYFGTFQLAVLPGETVMGGFYTGFGSDVEVSIGPWKWVRVDPDSLMGADLAVVRLRDPAVLGERIEAHSQYDAPLTLADIEGEP
jgi:hypothetical protein